MIPIHISLDLELYPESGIKDDATRDKIVAALIEQISSTLVDHHRLAQGPKAHILIKNLSARVA